MKANIHPDYHLTATISCACGNSWQAGSTKSELHTEICSQCHPFYTGKQNLIDTAGNVDRFKRKQELAAKAKANTVVKKPRKTRTAKA